MEYYYEDGELILKTEGKVHEKIVLFNNNYKRHIKIKHPEITMQKILEILDDPDYVYKHSRGTDTYHYEKDYGSDTYRVVVVAYKKYVKQVITAYRIGDTESFTVKHVHCIYDKVQDMKFLEETKKFEEDLDYFYELFGIENTEAQFNIKNIDEQIENEKLYKVES